MKKALCLLGLVALGSGVIWLCARGQFAVVAQTEASPSEVARATPADGNLRQPESVLLQPLTPTPGQLPPDYSPFDPIIVAPCTLNPIQVQDIAAQLDGQLVDIPVTLGQKVAKGETLGRLDNRKLLLQTQLLEIRANSPTEELIAKALFDEADSKVAYAEKANKDNAKAVPELEMKTYLAQRERYAQETKKAQEERQAARKELEKAQLLLEQHNLTCSVDGEVVRILRKPGETVKQAETIFRVSRIDQLRIEGFCKIQNARQLRVGMSALVEPEVQGRQLLELVGHTDTVTDVVVARDGKLIASASLDGKVMLWSWPAGQRLGVLSHPAAVHAVDVGVAADGYTLLTGCEDGRARLWSIAAGAIRGSPLELRGHEGAVRSVRIHPDGTSAVTAGDDRRIGCWALATGQHQGWLHAPGAFKQSAHQGAVTGLDFGPDGLLISTGSDNLQKAWRITANKGELLKTHRGRTGDVHRAGVSRDGRRIAFDHGDELRLLDPLQGSVEGTIQSWRNWRFQEFASFSPTGRLVLSAAADGRLGLWKIPTGDPATDRTPADRSGKGHSFEICSYQPPRVGKVKCAVFAPDEKTILSGGTDRLVRAWAVPDQALWQPRQAVLTYVGSEVEQGTDLVRIQADMPNSAQGAGRLLPGTLVVLKIFAEATPAN